MSLSLRNATGTDAPALSRICLLTCDAGKSGELLFDYPQLPGLVWAVPYVKLSSTFGFVLINDETQEVVGYIVGASDTRAFERAASEIWWPDLMLKYPTEGPNKVQGKEADMFYTHRFANPSVADEPSIQFSPAHMHMNILEEYQRKGWGKRMVGKVVEYLRDEVGLNGVWLGFDERNVGAAKFYERVGFRTYPGAAPQYVGLSFDSWRG